MQVHEHADEERIPLLNGINRGHDDHNQPPNGIDRVPDDHNWPPGHCFIVIVTIFIASYGSVSGSVDVQLYFLPLRDLLRNFLPVTVDKIHMLTGCKTNLTRTRTIQTVKWCVTSIRIFSLVFYFRIL